MDYDKIPFSKLSPQLGLPVVLKPGPVSDFYTIDPVTHGCWHPIPNNIALAVGPVDASGSRGPQQGDGWFYRIVAKSPALPDTVQESTNEKLIGPTKTADWFCFATKVPVDRFPVSNCEQVTVQMTWWQEIAQHSSDGMLRVWHQDIPIANPEVIKSVKIPKSGTINFRLSCGAYATNSFSATPVSDRMTQLDTLVQTLMKAQTSNQAPQAKPGTAPAKPIK